MSTHGKGDASPNGGRFEFEVLKRVSQGPTSDVELRRALTRTIAPKHLPQVLARMQVDGLVVRGAAAHGAKWSITAKGIERLPKAEPTWAASWRPLVIAQKPPRRPGSEDFRGVPSVMADKPHGWRHPC